MSKSRPRTTRKKPATVPAVAPDVDELRRRTPAHPWVIGKVDFGPAIAAVHDLAAWAFDLCARDVVDWPEGRRRVRNARRFVLGRLRGKDVRRIPYEDVLFTAGLLARIFEADLRLPMTQIVAALDRLGLPTEVVPLMPRRQAAVGAMYPHVPMPPITPLRPRPVAVGIEPEQPVCALCGCLHLLLRNAP